MKNAEKDYCDKKRQAIRVKFMLSTTIVTKKAQVLENLGFSNSIYVYELAVWRFRLTKTAYLAI